MIGIGFHFLFHSKGFFFDVDSSFLLFILKVFVTWVFLVSFYRFETEINRLFAKEFEHVVFSFFYEERVSFFRIGVHFFNKKGYGTR